MFLYLAFKEAFLKTELTQIGVFLTVKLKTKQGP